MSHDQGTHLHDQSQENKLEFKPEERTEDCKSYWSEVKWSHSVVSDSFVIPWSAAHQAPLPMGFHRQEYWSGLPFPSPGDLLDPGIEVASPALGEQPSGKSREFIYQGANPESWDLGQVSHSSLYASICSSGKDDNNDQKDYLKAHMR